MNRLTSSSDSTSVSAAVYRCRKSGPRRSGRCMTAVNHPPRGVKFRAPIALLHMGRESTYNIGVAAPDGEEEFASEAPRIARDLCQDAAAQPTSLLLEQWASMLLGAFWERRELAHGCRGADPIAVVGEPFLTAIARVGSADAKLALLAL